jgi:methylthioribose-1-phosphate isomerase
VYEREREFKYFIFYGAKRFCLVLSHCILFHLLGAPLIAIVALLGLSVDMNTNAHSIEELDKIDGDATAILLWIRDKMEYLKSSRPTAVNLANALQELDKAMEEAIKNMSSSTTTTATTKEVLCKVVLDYSEFMLERDVNDNKAIGKFGAEAILKKTGKDKINLVTICNTGSLATAGYGTALGVARSLQKMEKLESISALGMYCMYCMVSHSSSIRCHCFLLF